MYMHWGLLQVMEGLKCTIECTWCDECLTAGTQGDSCELISYHVAYEHGGMQATYINS